MILRHPMLLANWPSEGFFLARRLYAMTVVERLGLSEEGLVRAGCACYTTEDEAQRLIDGVRDITRR
jgi:selenocysteine lyase/cysteine desulfurase